MLESIIPTINIEEKQTYTLCPFIDENFEALKCYKGINCAKKCDALKDTLYIFSRTMKRKNNN